jgi:hypothetical protein
VVKTGVTHGPFGMIYPSSTLSAMLEASKRMQARRKR